ncbi:MAG: MFS transporter, partial [Dehalococcoidia bacterium]|nr:MFS transporter [Dehalococcoidia bacterium]
MMEATRKRPLSDKLPVGSWALYDFANSIFALNILGLYFTLWVTVDHGAPDILYSVAYSGSMMSIALTSPLLGAVSDRAKSRKPLLLFFTLICIGFTAMIGKVGGLPGGLMMFVVANYGYQSALVYYDSLLASVSSESNRGKISGLGVGVGYIGAILGILLVRPFVEAGGRESAFLPTALLFLFFALPCFLFVREEKGAGGGLNWSSMTAGYHQLVDTVAHLRRYTSLFRFILARFLYVDAINTVTAFMSVYLVKVIGFTDVEVQNYLIVATVFAVLGAFVYGRVVDWLGPKKTLVIILSQWVAVYIAVAATFYAPFFWIIGAIAGVNLGATWTTDRVFLTRLSPPERLGEFFGIYELAGRFAAVLGPMVWGITLVVLDGTGTIQYRVGILTLLAMLL